MAYERPGSIDSGPLPFQNLKHLALPSLQH